MWTSKLICGRNHTWFYLTFTLRQVKHLSDAVHVKYKIINHAI